MLSFVWDWVFDFLPWRVQLGIFVAVPLVIIIAVCILFLF